jgi:hypothetical protein
MTQTDPCPCTWYGKPCEETRSHYHACAVPNTRGTDETDGEMVINPSRTFTLQMVHVPYPGDRYFMGRSDEGFHLSLTFPASEWQALGEPKTLEARISLP